MGKIKANSKKVQEQRKNARAASTRVWRKEARDAGLCGICGIRKPAAGKKQCVVCRKHKAQTKARRDERHAEAIAAGICIKCFKRRPKSGSRMCPACLKKAREVLAGRKLATAARRAEVIKLGLRAAVASFRPANTSNGSS